MAPLIEMQQIGKRFGPVQALVDASLQAEAGQIHVILGENGAGKSSLMNVLVGLYQPDQGAVLIAGNPAAIRSPADAINLGIAMVPQHVELIPKLTVWENVILGREGSGWWLNRKRARETVQALSDRYQLGLDPDTLAGSLSAGQQQKVELLKVLYRQARILIFDEPTTFLTPQESDALFETMVRLSSEGLAVFVVTHKLRDALRFGHRLTVMRAGRVVAVADRSDGVVEEQLIQWMMGTDLASSRDLMQPPELPVVPDGAPHLLAIEALSTKGEGRIGLQEVSLRLRRGEVHGIAGITGNGQRELAEAILGLVPATGRIALADRPVDQLPVAKRLQQGLFLIPEDRIHDGILPTMALFENLVLGRHRELFRPLAYRAGEARRMGSEAIREYEVKAPGPGVPIAFLSGGNMQKVIVARAVGHAGAHDPAVIVAVNPTRGLDVRTVRQVHDRLRAIAAEGGAILLMSEDLDELMENCHAISVIQRGAIVASFTGPAYDRYQIGEAMLGRDFKGVTA